MSFIYMKHTEILLRSKLVSVGHCHILEAILCFVLVPKVLFPFSFPPFSFSFFPFPFRSFGDVGLYIIRLLRRTINMLHAYLACCVILYI